MWISRILALASLFLIAPAAFCASEEPVTLVLECKGSVTEYKNNILRWTDGGPIYYRIKLHSSYAVVEFRMGEENYRFADRFNLKTYNSSYELELPSNTTLLSQNIEIDRLDRNFTTMIIDNDITNKYFGSCEKIDDTPKF
jgi:hypothetical protein